MTTAINFAVPEGACDCHTHVFEDAAQLFTARSWSKTQRGSTTFDPLG